MKPLKAQEAAYAYWLSDKLTSYCSEAMSFT